MTDITERLRRIYVASGANYVQEAADTIQKLRAEIAECKRLMAELIDEFDEHDDCENLEATFALRQKARAALVKEK